MRIQLWLIAVIAAAVLGGVAYAAIPDAGGVYTACKLNATGTIRLIDPSLGSSSLLSHCTALEARITWNQSGRPGVSPTVAQLAAGDSHCGGAGGASITDATGNVAYVCNGAAGQQGQQGQPGKDGAPFSGTFTSPNGQFTLTVADGGVSIVGPDSSVSLPAAGGITIRGGRVLLHADDFDTEVMHDASTFVGHDRVENVGNDDTRHIGGDRTEAVDGNDALTVHKAETLTVDRDRHLTVGGNDLVRISGGRSDDVSGLLSLRASGGASIQGSTIALNGMGACKPAARQDDFVNSIQILTGSPTVCIGG